MALALDGLRRLSRCAQRVEAVDGRGEDGVEVLVVVAIVIYDDNSPRLVGLAMSTNIIPRDAGHVSPLIHHVKTYSLAHSEFRGHSEAFTRRANIDALRH